MINDANIDPQNSASSQPVAPSRITRKKYKTIITRINRLITPFNDIASMNLLIRLIEDLIYSEYDVNQMFTSDILIPNFTISSIYGLVSAIYEIYLSLKIKEPFLIGDNSYNHTMYLMEELTHQFPGITLPMTSSSI